MFGGMFKGQYDVSEMSLGELIYYVSRDNASFKAIPVFPSRIFRHGFLFVRKNSGIKTPGDLNGRKLGFLRWVQTAALWMRGMLIDQYGVSPSGSEWYVASMHHWDDADPGATVEPRDGSVIRWMKANGKNTADRACQSLFSGEVDALGVTENQLSALLGRADVQRLFDNPREVEVQYFRKTRILPIMHILAVRNETAEKFPDLPEQLFRLFVGARRWAQKWRRAIPSLVEGWPNFYFAQEEEIFKCDPWAYGVEANRHVLSTFLGYCHAQGVSARKLAPEDLFHSSTVKLSE
jgi:4,5-dihydroxyphthalate decarboxylase